MVDYSKLNELYEQVEEAELLEDGPLPTGWYPVEVAGFTKDLTNHDVPRVRLQLRVDFQAHHGFISFHSSHNR